MDGTWRKVSQPVMCLNHGCREFPLCMAACSLAVSVRIIPEVEIIQAGIT